MRDHITRDMSMCGICQKKQQNKYGLLLEKEAHVHQMLGNLIRGFEIQDNPYLNSDDPWSGILAAASFAMCSMYHTTLHVMPCQLVFGRDMILNMQYLADWTAIKACSQARADPQEYYY